MSFAIDPRDTSDPAEILRSLLDPERRGALYPWLHRLRQVAPIWRSEDPLVPRGWVLSRYADIREVLRHPSAFSDERNAEIFDVGEAGAAFTAMMRKQILYLSPADHDRIRGLVARHFTPRSVERWRASAEREVLRLLDLAVDRGKLELVRDLAYPLPIAVVCEMLGVPRDDVPLVFEWAHDFARRGDVAALTPEVIRRGESATLGFRDYFLDLARERRSRPRDDLTTLLANARDARGPLTDDELAATCVILLQAGHETTADLIGLGLRGLLLEPGAMARLRARPDLVPNAVLELLRWDTSVQISQRRSREAIEIGGIRVPAGETFVLLNGAANRDPAAYPDPDVLDVDRVPRDHLAFGLGRHRCLGASLARVEIETAIAAIVRRFPRLELDGEPVFRGSFFLRGLASLPLRFGADSRKGISS
ncbi:MAG: cytochrome P450 [Myxococcota bacterium]